MLQVWYSVGRFLCKCYLFFEYTPLAPHLIQPMDIGERTFAPYFRAFPFATVLAENLIGEYAE